MQVRVAAARTLEARFGTATDASRERSTRVEHTHERIRAGSARRESRVRGRLTIRSAREPLITHALEAVASLCSALIGAARVAAPTVPSSAATTTREAGIPTLGEGGLAGGLRGHEIVAARAEAAREATTRRAGVARIGAVLTAGGLRLLDRRHAHLLRACACDTALARRGRRGASDRGEARNQRNAYHRESAHVSTVSACADDRSRGNAHAWHRALPRDTFRTGHGRGRLPPAGGILVGGAAGARAVLRPRGHRVAVADGSPGGSGPAEVTGVRGV